MHPYKLTSFSRYVWDIEKASQITASTAASSLENAGTTQKESIKEPTSTQASNSDKINAESMLWIALQTTAKDMS